MSDEGEVVEVVENTETPAEEPVVESVEEKVEEETPEVPKEEKVEPPVPKGVQKRIDRAVRQKYEAEARSKMLEERLAHLEARQAPQAAPKDEAEPTIENYDNFDQYVAAKAAYIAKRQIESTMTEREQREASVRAQAERQKTVESWNKRVDKFTAKMPDFEEVITSSEVAMTDPMQQAIMESDVGPELAYYLANHPDEATDIARMSPIGAIRTLGRIEERLSKPNVKTTNAPAPLSKISSASKVSKDPSAMSQAEFEKWRKTVIAAR